MPWGFSGWSMKDPLVNRIMRRIKLRQSTTWQMSATYYHVDIYVEYSKYNLYWTHSNGYYFLIPIILSGRVYNVHSTLCTLYTVHCVHYTQWTLYTVHNVQITMNGVRVRLWMCTLYHYTVHCTVYNIHGTGYSVHCKFLSRTMYDVQYTSYHTPRTMYSVHYTRYSAQRTLYVEHCTSYTIPRTMRSVQYTSYHTLRTIYVIPYTTYNVLRTLHHA